MKAESNRERVSASPVSDLNLQCMQEASLRVCHAYRRTKVLADGLPTNNDETTHQQSFCLHHQTVRLIMGMVMSY